MASEPEVDFSTDLRKLYVLGERVGQGGMAEVFAATRPGAVRPDVAVKRIMPGMAELSRLLERFRNEVDLLERCRSPMVVALRETGHVDDVPAYAMDLCIGSLYTAAKDRPMSLLQMLRYASEVLVALDAVHAAGCVHRDVKPGNVLIGLDGRARLADFGISKHPQFRVTMPGRRVGTPAFIAADQADSPMDAVPAHDMFSLGLVILAVSTHQKPAAITKPEERARTLRQFPAATAHLLERATHPNPGQRYASAGEMLVDVQRALADMGGDQPHYHTFRSARGGVEHPFAEGETLCSCGERVRRREIARAGQPLSYGHRDGSLCRHGRAELRRLLEAA